MRPVEACPFDAPDERSSLDLQKHRSLHPDGLRLMTTCFGRAWRARDDREAAFESFVFAWIAVNAWAACVTGEDADREYMRRLSRDVGLRAAFDELLREDQEFRREVESFFTLLPIFKAQRLRRAGVRVDESASRRETVHRYFAAGITEFEPECAKYHLDRGEAIPCDWPHFINAVYRVRCNLFHGEKAAHSEMDQKIVRSALMSLTGFFRGAHIL
ncbi:MAG TPA: hypothetical protein PKM45_00255 [Giesbergeria sp.]|nr:hypothetical protein [Giesbergeria sp.]